ncbi:unnamed protein product [Durusdinium trenchii]|uniref:G domain-containing protein n=1 Tax=Durusdinium trenchii TaxID=1381693 RepID=A0ABP0RQ19_9DINO
MDTKPTPWHSLSESVRIGLLRESSCRQVPQAAGPEIALVGRSNAGKSTLLNCILASRDLRGVAATSFQGGRTRTLNWYPMGYEEPIGWAGNGVRLKVQSEPETLAEVIAAGKGCCLVDCFGLGTVDYSLRAARLQTWAPLLQGFVSERRALGMVCHLVSCEQQGQLSEGDEQLVEIFQKCEKERVRRQIAPFRYVVILTKTDLASSPADVERFAEQVGARLKEMGQTVWKIVTCTSMSEDGSGIREVAEIIDEAKKVGWEDLPEWIEDAFLTPRPPGGKTTTQRRELRNNFTQSRRVSSRHPPRGGPGAKTMLPPRV